MRKNSRKTQALLCAHDNMYVCFVVVCAAYIRACLPVSLCVYVAQVYYNPQHLATDLAKLQREGLKPSELDEITEILKAKSEEAKKVDSIATTINAFRDARLAAMQRERMSAATLSTLSKGAALATQQQLQHQQGQGQGLALPAQAGVPAPSAAAKVPSPLTAMAAEVQMTRLGLGLVNGVQLPGVVMPSPTLVAGPDSGRASQAVPGTGVELPRPADSEPCPAGVSPLRDWVAPAGGLGPPIVPVQPVTVASTPPTSANATASTTSALTVDIGASPAVSAAAKETVVDVSVPAQPEDNNL